MPLVSISNVSVSVKVLVALLFFLTTAVDVEHFVYVRRSNEFYITTPAKKTCVDSTFIILFLALTLSKQTRYFKESKWIMRMR